MSTTPKPVPDQRPHQADIDDEKVAMVLSLIPTEPPFYHSRHVHYIATLPAKLDSRDSYEGAVVEHLKMSGIYWSLAALSILQSPEQVDTLLGVTMTDSTTIAAASNATSLVDWVMQCWDEQAGGFGGNVGHGAHLLYTLSAVQVLAMADRLDLVDVSSIAEYVQSLQQPDGSFAGDEWGEIDTRFTYCAVSILSILKRLDQSTIDVDKAAMYIFRCRNLDGGFGCVVGSESHAGQVFCCVGALSIMNKLTFLQRKDVDLLCWWLCERQCDSGGLNGRSEKQADVCYSWWILSALSILGRVEWISKVRLGSFILKCQDDVDGGIADRPGDMADVFHTFFGVAGLSLLGYLHSNVNGISSMSYRKIDPVFALPRDVVERLRLRAQVMLWQTEEAGHWLAVYNIEYGQNL